jgi:protein SCO1/2
METAIETSRCENSERASRESRADWWIAALVLGMWCWPSVGAGQSAAGSAQPSNLETGDNPEAQKLEEVRYDQNLGESIPLGLEFQNTRGETVPLGRYFDEERPVIVVLGYFECPMLCGLVRRSLVDTLAEIDLEMGRDYTVVSVSVDPGEGPDLARKNTDSVIERYRKKGGVASDELARTGWHDLTGDKEAIDELAETVGFNYRYDQEKGQYLHPSGFAVASPSGDISKYFLGVEYDPRDLRLGLVDAGKGEVGTAIDQVLLRCYQYNPETGTYSFAIMRILRVLAIVTALLLAGAIWRMLQTNGRLEQPSGPDSPADKEEA